MTYLDTAPSGLGALPLGEALERFANSDPTPGGGSAAALAGALAGALAAMAAGVSARKPETEDAGVELVALAVKAHALMEKLVAGADRDSSSFEEVTAAYRLPRETEEQKRDRKAAIQNALKLAATTPLENARVCLQAAELARDAARLGKPGVLTDASVGVLLALTGIEGAVLNVAVNLELIRDEEFVGHARAQVASLLEAASTMRASLWSTLRERMTALPG